MELNGLRGGSEIGRTHGHKKPVRHHRRELSELVGVRCVCFSARSSRQDREHDPAEGAATVVSKHSSGY